MNLPDLINGSFELVGSVALWANVVKLKKDKQVAGVYWPTTLFFAGWGLWNCFYYPWLGQWASFVGGCFITAANLVWAGMAVYYSRNPCPMMFEARMLTATRIRKPSEIIPILYKRNCGCPAGESGVKGENGLVYES